MVGVVKTEDGKPSNLNVSTLLEAWNSTYMRNVRKAMLVGEKPASCLKCYNEESAGHRSKRQWESEYWSNQNRTDLRSLLADTAEDGSVPPKLVYVDIRMGTKCQLACIICSPRDSSGWIKDWKKLYPQIEIKELKENMQWENKGSLNGSSYNWHKDNPDFWSQLYDQIPNMKQLYFAGGESTVIDEHYSLLRKVIEMGFAGGIELRYNSNGVELPPELFELWTHFKSVRFHYSVDSLGEINDYVRFPSKWAHTVEQMHLLDATPDHVTVTIACAVSALNIFYIPDFIKWKLEQGFKKINAYPFGGGLINTHLVYHPAQVNVKVLTHSQKREVAEKFDAFYIWLKENWALSGAPDYDTFMADDYSIKRLQGLVKFMNDGDWSRRQPEFREYVVKLDGVRGTNFRETFRDIAHWIGNE